MINTAITLARKCWWLIPLVLFVVLTFTNLNTGNHQLFNLEPYPDGLLYIVPAWSVAQGGNWVIANLGMAIRPWVPPLYSVVLLPVFLLSSSPASFYVTNLILGLISLGLFISSTYQVTRSRWVSGLAALIYLSQAVLIWLVGLPLSENLTITLVLLAFWLLITPRLDTWRVVGLAVTSVALVLTRYALIPLAGVIVCLSLYRLYLQPNRWRQIALMLAVLTVGAVLVLTHQMWSSQNLFLLWQPLSETNTGTTFTALSFAYIPANANFYGSALLGSDTRLLWQTTSLIGFGVWLLIVEMVVAKFLNPDQVRARFTSYLFLLAIVLVPLFFYALDARYLVPAIPVLLSMAAIGLAAAYRRFSYWALLYVIFAVASSFLSQRQLWRSTLVANWLQRSQAWNYQAVLFLDTQLSASDRATVITALPPQLFYLYQAESVRPAPLSIFQEFLSKNQQVWSTIPLTTTPLTQVELMTYYRQLLERGETIYISNAYVTHRSEVANDFEQFKNQFELNLVAEGCQQTCNLYQLLPKNDTMEHDAEN